MGQGISYTMLIPALASAACSSAGSDLETVYGGYRDLHSVEAFTYAVDPSTFEFVGGGRVH